MNFQFIKREIASNSLSSFFIEKGIAGQTFLPQSGAIKKSIKKNKRKTSEDVVIEWEGDPKDSNIDIKHTDHGYTITIKTSDLTILS